MLNTLYQHCVINLNDSKVKDIVTSNIRAGMFQISRMQQFLVPNNINDPISISYVLALAYFMADLCYLSIPIIGRGKAL